MSKVCSERRVGGAEREREVESVWERAMEDELYLELVNLRLLEIMVEAAENDYFKLSGLRKRNRSVRASDMRHAQRLIEVRRAAFEKEYERLLMEHADEEEELITLLETPLIDLIEPERQQELIEQFSDLSDPENPWEGLEGDSSDNDFRPLQPL